MPNVVFVVPYVMENTLRFVRAAAGLPGVRLGVVSQDPLERLPFEVRQLLHGFHQVDEAMQAAPLADGVRALGRQLGSVELLLGVLEPLQVPLAEVRERLRLPGMSVVTARNFREKGRMKEVFAAHQLPCARHRLCTTAAEALAFAVANGYPVVVKPPAGAGARTTVRADTAEQLTEFLQSTPPAPGQEVLVEEFVRGREFSFDSVTLHGRHVFHSISAYHPTPLEVLANPWIQWCVVLPREIEGPEFAPIHRLGPQALAALGMQTGMSHMEWFRRADGSLAIGEVAARPPGAQFMTLMSYAHDTDMYRAWAQLMIFDRFAAPPRRYAAGAAYLRGQGEGKVQRVVGFEEVQRRLDDLIVEVQLPKHGQAKADSYEGDGYVIVRHPETAVVEQALAYIVKSLRVELG